MRLKMGMADQALRAGRSLGMATDLLALKTKEVLVLS